MAASSDIGTRATLIATRSRDERDPTAKINAIMRIGSELSEKSVSTIVNDSVRGDDIFVDVATKTSFLSVAIVESVDVVFATEKR
jgi:hypothetical protein